ncbi:MAG TPA: DUF1854 domain-containing protein [Janthinobacterium sp.]|nr:DUF1854 domain-containing protein [Janthinobacterium sp.]
MTSTNFELSRNAFGKLTLTNGAGATFAEVAPVRAFPVQAPQDGIALVSPDGKEVAWIDRLEDLPAPQRALVAEELGAREFMPEISRIDAVSSYATPSTWTVATDRGETELVLRGEEDIRRIGSDSLLISDTHGIHFLIRNTQELDRHSRKILDRFL